MSTTPEPTKGTPRVEGNPPPTIRAWFNSLADWVRDRMGESVATIDDLPTTFLWVGRHCNVESLDVVFKYVGAGAWRPTGPRATSAPAVLPGAGNPPTPQSPIRIQSGTHVQAVNAAGDGMNIVFPEAFPNGLISVVVTSGDGGLDGSVKGTVNATRAQVGVKWQAVGAGGARRANWIAIGW